MQERPSSFPRRPCARGGGARAPPPPNLSPSVCAHDDNRGAAALASIVAMAAWPAARFPARDPSLVAGGAVAVEASSRGCRLAFDKLGFKADVAVAVTRVDRLGD